MTLSILKSKIHRAVVTETNIEYVGSITIDETLMKAAGLFPFEEVHVWNLTNGSRIVTYVIAGAADSGVICLNGAAAHHHRVGDRVIIGAFAGLSESEARNFKPKIIIVDQKNRIEKTLS